MRHQWARTEKLFFAALTSRATSRSFMLLNPRPPRFFLLVVLLHNSHIIPCSPRFLYPFHGSGISNIQLIYMLPWHSPFICLYVLRAAQIYHITFFLIWKTENGGFIAIQSDYCCWFLCAFLPHFNQKESLSLYLALDLHDICKGLVRLVIPLLSRSRADLPRNKSKLCQTFSHCCGGVFFIIQNDKMDY